MKRFLIVLLLLLFALPTTVFAGDGSSLGAGVSAIFSIIFLFVMPYLMFGAIKKANEEYKLAAKFALGWMIISRFGAMAIMGAGMGNPLPILLEGLRPLDLPLMILFENVFGSTIDTFVLLTFGEGFFFIFSDMIFLAICYFLYKGMRKFMGPKLSLSLICLILLLIAVPLGFMMLVLGSGGH
ncbi:hypothetical protein HOG48_02820 [Candidatus Peregrinibacteria bacterium]|jgi:hypothetical protein|nr:hypothetical protein [Candidatus Peregrinibacteria bacterium]